MRAVNLLPREATKQRTTPFGLSPQSLPAVVGAGLGVVLVAFLAISFMHASGKVSDAKTRLREAETQLANTPQPPEAKPVPNAQLVGEKSARVTAVSVAIGARLSVDRVLRELSLVLPDDVTLSTLSISQSGDATTQTAELSLGGYTYSHDSVARLLSRLALVPDLTAVVLGGSSTAAVAGGSSSSSTSGATGSVSFTISADVKLPPGAAAVAAPPPVAPPPSTSTDTTSSGASG